MVATIEKIPTGLDAITSADLKFGLSAVGGNVYANLAYADMSSTESPPGQNPHQSDFVNYMLYPNGLGAYKYRSSYICLGPADTGPTLTAQRDGVNPETAFLLRT